MSDSPTITSAANPKIKAAVKLRRSRDRREGGLFLAEGPREVQRAIEAGLDVLEVFHCPDLVKEQGVSATLSGLHESVAVYTVTEPLLKMLAYRDAPEGIIAVVRQPVWELEELSAIRGGGVDELYLIAVGTAKPGNLGAMARSAEAAGCKAVLACGTPVDAFNPNAIRASTCAVFTLPIVNVDEGCAIKYLRDNGIRIAATTPDGERAQRYTDTDLAGPLALVIGPEDTGLGDAWLDAADLCLSIPTLGRTVDSLNAANAAAVLLFEAVRQRMGKT
jgi:RNA methyltransferase, TrmH family